MELRALILGAILIGFAPIFAKLTGLPGGWMAVYRCGFSSLLLFLLLLVRGRGDLRVFIPQNFYLLLLPGAFFGFDMFVWHYSIDYVGSGLATILANTQILYVALIGRLFFQEKITLRFLLSSLMTLVGVVILIQPDTFSGEGDSKYWWGILFGAMTGFLYAGFTSTLKATFRHLNLRSDFNSVMVRLFWVCLTAFCITLVGENLLQTEVPRLTSQSVAWSISVALFPQILGWYLITTSIDRLPISMSGLLLLIQPIVATIAGFLIFQEPLGPLRISGALLTLVGIYLGTQAYREP